MPHVVLSPHLDDAVLSCGGMLAQLHRNAVSAVVVSIFAGLVANNEPLSPFAAAMHQVWGAPEKTVALRRAEDRAALAYLGLEAHWLSFKDAIYRGKPEHGEWFYTDNTELFGAIHPSEQDLPQAIAASLRDFLRRQQLFNKPLAFYVPLAIGNHVDHQLTRAAAKYLVRPGDTVLFYEDYPYAQWNPADKARAMAETAKLWGGDGWEPYPVILTEDDLQQKLAAIAEYQSQLGMLFGDEAEMRQQVRIFSTAQSDTPVENYWKRENSS